MFSSTYSSAFQQSSEETKNPRLDSKKRAKRRRKRRRKEVEERYAGLTFSSSFSQSTSQSLAGSVWGNPSPVATPQGSQDNSAAIPTSAITSLRFSVSASILFPLLWAAQRTVILTWLVHLVLLCTSLLPPVLVVTKQMDVFRGTDGCCCGPSAPVPTYPRQGENGDESRESLFTGMGSDVATNLMLAMELAAITTTTTKDSLIANSSHIYCDKLLERAAASTAADEKFLDRIMRTYLLSAAVAAIHTFSQTHHDREEEKKRTGSLPFSCSAATVCFLPQELRVSQYFWILAA